MNKNAEELGLPVRPFLYTADQIATLLSVSTETVRSQYFQYPDRMVGRRRPDKMVARNIAPEGKRPEWRVAERELIRWMRNRGMKVYERSWTRS